jgi:lipopolysaccharide heptosyltransferase II
MKQYKKILIVRTDRIGDVVLSTPVIEALRKTYPQSWIAFMTRPYTADILQGNPLLDEIIIYDKDGRQRGWLANIIFALSLRKKKFDVAIILNATNRAHIITCLAGIPKRVGYERRCSFLLTDKIKDEKSKGLKHESAYNFDLLKLIGVNEESKKTLVPVLQEDIDFITTYLHNKDVRQSDKLIIVHPSASCNSKIWPQENFTEAIKKLLIKNNVKIILICSQEHSDICQAIYKEFPPGRIFILKELKLKKLTALFNKASLLISTDSGPVHLAVAAGCPVVDIFGRNQAGLSPRRWGPLDEESIVLHKPENCQPCLAHNCRNENKCLKNITVEDVVNAAEKILKNTRR